MMNTMYVFNIFQDDADTLLSVEKNRFLKQKVPDLIENVKVSIPLWASLVKHGVISEVVKENIKVSSPF